MYAGVGAAGSGDAHPMAVHAHERLLEYALHGARRIDALRVLNLPTGEVGAVVGNGRPNGASQGRPTGQTPACGALP